MRPGVREEAPPGSVLLVVHNFVARSPDELSLAKGDRVELIERDDDFGDGWFLGRHVGNGKTGLFPEVYTTVAPKATLNSVVHQRGASDGPARTSQNSGNAVTPSYPTAERHSSSSAMLARPTSVTAAEQSTSTTMLQTQTPLRTSLPASALNNPVAAASPVMNETLSVINEHMNDMNTPPGSFTNGSKRDSAGGLASFSYIAGQETDEENQLHTEDEVMGWTPDRVAEYLEDQGVEKSHCDVFKEQEISGEVLLAMEQSSLFLKEFQLGPVGRRLKTWHKIRALQDEIRQSKGPEAQNGIPAYLEDGSNGDLGRNRATTVGSAFPRALDTARQAAAPTRSNTFQPTSPAAPSTTGDDVTPLTVGPEGSWKPSAQSIREMQLSRRESRRNSSIDADTAEASIAAGERESHRKQPSLDQNWLPGQPQSNGHPSGHGHTLSTESALSNRDSTFLTSPSPNDVDLDRGYFSSNELDSRSRNSKKAQIKRESTTGSRPAGHTRATSFTNRRSTHSGRGTSSDNFRDSVSPTISQGILGAMSSVGSTFSSMRSSTSPQLARKQLVPGADGFSPVVTKLDHSASTDALTNSPNTAAGAESTTSPRIPFFGAHKPKITGLRSISDAMTKNEKSTASPGKDADGSPARTGSTTPSTDTRSLEIQKQEAQARVSAGSANNLVPPVAMQRRMRPKTKKTTSAYTRGLEKKTPAEQIIGSDYSGWMKKKSGSLMTTWKSRLFILKGRRLSYYYTDNDTEEKGLIDISFHRVLPAHNETLTGLHAAMTGAAGSPSSPRESATPTAAAQDLKQNPSVGEGSDGVFIFKLVPPKSGLSKGVNFTRPTVHYFAVNSRQEGRLWMAALMKATIDRDEDGMVTTTYNQKTISLAKARARRERPPALKESDNEDLAELEGEDDSSGKGLGIGGLAERADAVGGAEREDGSSQAPSTTATGTDSFYEKDSETVVCN